MAVEILGLGIDASGARQGAMEWGRATEQIRRGATQATGTIRDMDRRTGMLGQTFQQVRMMAIQMFGVLGTGALIRQTIQTISGFESTMAELRGVAQATDLQMRLFTETARELGATTRFSATEAGEGLLFLARAGFDVQQATAALPGTLDLAAAAGLGLGEAADIASNLLAQFRLEADQMNRVGDILVNTANNANTNVQQLAQAMTYAGPVAAALNVSMEETAASIGVLGDAGIQASMAGTSLRMIMLELIRESNGLTAVIDRLGLTMEDIDPRTHGIIGAFDALNQAGAEFNDLQQIFSARALGSAAVLAEYTDNARRLRDANLEVNDTARIQAEIMNQTLAGAWRSLISAFQEAMLQVGDTGLLGGLRGLVVTITDTVRILIGMESLIEGNTRVARALANAVMMVTTAFAAWSALRIAALMTSITAAVVAQTLAWRGLTAAMMRNPIGLVAVAAGGAITALWALRDTTIQLGTATLRVGDMIAATWEHVQDVTELMWRGFVDTAVWAWDNVRNIVGTGRDIIVTAISGLANLIPIDWRGMWAAMLTVARTTANTIVGIMVGMVEAVQAAFAALDVPARMLANIDLSDPKAAIGTLVGTAAYATAMPLMDAKAAFANALERDYVQIAEEAGRAAGINFMQAWRAIIDLPELTVLPMILGASLESIRIRAEQRAQERAERLAELEGLMPDPGTPPDLQMLLGDIDEHAAANDVLDERIDLVAQLIARYAEEEEILRAVQGVYHDRQNAVEVETEIISLRNALLREGLELSAEDEQRIRNQIAAVQELRREQDRLEDSARRMQFIMDRAARTLADGFTDAIVQARTLTGVLEDLWRSLMRLVIHQTVSAPLATGITGMFQNMFNSSPSPLQQGYMLAKGGVVQSSGPLTMAQSGLIVDRATRFGNIMAGEAGPELVTTAVLPLQRTSDGNLGVRTDASAAPTVNISQHFPPGTDIDSFRRSNRQILTSITRQIGNNA